MVRRALLALEATSLERHHAGEPGGGNPDKCAHASAAPPGVRSTAAAVLRLVEDDHLRR